MVVRVHEAVCEPRGHLQGLSNTKSDQVNQRRPMGRTVSAGSSLLSSFMPGTPVAASHTSERPVKAWGSS